MKNRRTNHPPSGLIKSVVRLGSPRFLKPMERHRRIPAVVILVASIMTMISFSIYHLYSGNDWIAAADVVALIGAFIGLIYLNKTEKGLIVYWIISIVFMGISIITVVFGRQEISYFLWAFVPPAVVFSILGKKAGMAMSLAYFAVALVLMTAPERIMGSAPYSIFVIVRYAVIYMILTFILYYYESSQQLLFEYIRKEKDKFEFASKRDHLTGLSNRRDLFERIRNEQQRQTRLNNAFTLIMGDIDNFKALNDSYGHDAGDYVLKSIARLLKDQIRGIDCSARWGGEEFLIMLIETDIENGKLVAERIRQKIETAIIIHNGISIPVTMTFGLSQYNGTDDTIESCIKRADMALYTGKQQGKNRVVVGI